MKIGMLVFDKAFLGWYNHRQVNKHFRCRISADLSGEKGSRVKSPHELVAVMTESCFRYLSTVIGEGREDEVRC